MLIMASMEAAAPESAEDALGDERSGPGGGSGSRPADFSVLLSARWVSTPCDAEYPRAQQSSARALVFPVTRRLSCRPATAGTAQHNSVKSCSLKSRKSFSSSVKRMPRT